MHPRRRPYVLLSLFALVTFAAPASAWACSCSDAGLGDPVAVAQTVDVVFVGTVVRVDEPWTLALARDSNNESLANVSAMLGSVADDSVRTVFSVEQAWKGVDTDEVVVDTGDGRCCNCSLGVVWEPGERALILGNRGDDGFVHVGFCLPPRAPEAAEALVAAWGPGQRSFPKAQLLAYWREWIPWLIGSLVTLGLTLLVRRSPRAARQ